MAGRQGTRRPAACGQGARGSGVLRQGIGAVVAAFLAAAGCAGARAADVPRADRFFVYNLTSASDLGGLYLAPAGTTDWGPNQTLNDRDHQLEPTERLAVTGIGHGVYDVRAVTTQGHACVKVAVDLTHDTTFDIRDADLACP
jgi:hypothetical protein